MPEICENCRESFNAENLTRCGCGNGYCSRCLSPHLDQSGHRLPKGGWTGEAIERLTYYVRKRSVWQDWHLKEQKHPYFDERFTPTIKRPAKESFASLLDCSQRPIKPLPGGVGTLASRQKYLADQGYMFWADIELFGRSGKPVVRIELTPEELARETSLFTEKAGPWDVGDALGRLVMEKLRDEHCVEINYVAGV